MLGSYGDRLPYALAAPANDGVTLCAAGLTGVHSREHSFTMTGGDTACRYLDSLVGQLVSPLLSAGISVCDPVVMTSPQRCRMRFIRSRAGMVARVGLAHWFFANLYEGVVDVPQLLAQARPRRAPGVLTRGSPLRYFAPAAPVTFAATAVALVDRWRSGGDRRAVAAAAAGITSALGMSGYLIGTVNHRLLHADEPLPPLEQDRLVRVWHQVNAARLVALLVALAAMARQGTTPHESPDTCPHAGRASPGKLWHW